MKVILLSPAEKEVAESADHYAGESIKAALGFLAEVDRAIEEISRDPERCPIVGDSVRVKHLKRFPYSIFYRIESDIAAVQAVAHNSRRPGYWSTR